MPMKLTGVKLNKAEIGKQILKGRGTRAELARRAERVKTVAGAGMEVSTMTGRTRARASVITADYDARRREAKTRDLSRAFDAARG